MEVDSKHVVALIVQASHNKPQFAGPAFIRTGSESKNASEQTFANLISRRNSKARPLLEAMRKKEKVTVFYWTHGRSNRHVGAASYPDCEVIECNPQYALLQSSTSEPLSADLDRITLKWNHVTRQLQVDIDG
jgi:hypothetical protein